MPMSARQRSLVELIFWLLLAIAVGILVCAR